MNRKIEAVKKKRADKILEREAVEKQLKQQTKLTESIDNLNELLNGQEKFDYEKLHKQLLTIDQRLDLAPYFKSLEKSLKTQSPPHTTSKTKIDGFSKLLRAVKLRLDTQIANIEHLLKKFE